MPIDYNHEDEIVLGKNLKSGDCIRSKIWNHNKDGNEMGIIASTTFEDNKASRGLKSFYEDHSAYEIYDINCPCDGPYSSRLKPEQEFKVIRSRDDILYTYRTIEHQLLSRSADLIKQRNELMDIKEEAFDRINIRCKKIEEEIKNEKD